MSDPSASNLTRIADLVGNNDNILNLGETWQYTANHTVTQAEIDTNGGGDGTIDNTASVTTTQGASSSDGASVPVAALTYSMTIDKIALGYNDLDNTDTVTAGDKLVYKFVVHNTGTGTQTGIQVSDPAATVVVTGGTLASLAPGADSGTHWGGTYALNSLDISNGYYDNEAVANSDQGNAVTGNVHTILAGLNELPI